MKRIASCGGMHVRAVDPTDGLFDASEHLDQVCEFVKAFNESGQPRDIESVDLFAGEGVFQRKCQEKGMKSEGVELKKDPVKQNLLCAEGFNFALHLILRVAPCTN